MSEAKVKVEGGEQEYIHLIVSGQDSTVFNFHVKKNTPMAKIKKFYADRNGLKVETLRFIFAGERVTDEDTANSLEMEEGETIEVYVEQIGG